MTRYHKNSFDGDTEENNEKRPIWLGDLRNETAEPENELPVVRFHVLTAASMKMFVFWDVAPCSLVEIDRRFRGAYCLHNQGRFYQITRRSIPEDSHLRITCLFDTLSTLYLAVFVLNA
jgi:hypothetical protein